MKKYVFGSLLVVLMLFTFTPIVKPFEYTWYIYYEEGISVGLPIDFKGGDKIYWSFETYNEECQIELSFNQHASNCTFNVIVSQGKEKDEGILVVPRCQNYTDDSYISFHVYNMDPFGREGYLDLIILKNLPIEEEPEDSNEINFPIIKGYNLIVLIGILGIISIRITKKNRDKVS